MKSTFVALNEKYLIEYVIGISWCNVIGFVSGPGEASMITGDFYLSAQITLLAQSDFGISQICKNLKLRTWE